MLWNRQFILEGKMNVTWQLMWDVCLLESKESSKCTGESVLSRMICGLKQSLSNKKYVCFHFFLKIVMSDVEVKIKLINTSRQRWYGRSSIIRAFSCQPSSLLPKRSFRFTFLPKILSCTIGVISLTPWVSGPGRRFCLAMLQVFLVYSQSHWYSRHHSLDLTLQMNT